jgi:hypothetical protein
VLADVSSSVRIAWGYDNANKVWKKWQPGGASNTLLTMEPGKGYWILMNEVGALSMSGWQSPPRYVPLFGGWNLVGYSDVGNKDLAMALTNFPVMWQIVWAWDRGVWKAKMAGVNNLFGISEPTYIINGGAYWIKVKDGHTGNWDQDTTAPGTPAGVTATAVMGSQINLSWTAPADAFGVQGYKIYRSGTYLKSVVPPSASDTGLSAGTQYCYSVSAYDYAGHESARSSEVCVYLPQINDVPTISNLLFQPDHAKAYSGNVTVTGYADFVDQGGNITTFWLQTPFGAISTAIQGAAGLTSGTGYGAVVVSTAGPAGTYPFSVWVTDSKGLSSNTLTGQFTLTP